MMKPQVRNRILLVSCAVILLCVCMIAGVSYALFTESVNVQNHLQAADLDIRLTRLDLWYNNLNADGELEEFYVEDDVDFTTTTFAEKNVFGIDSSGILIVPGTYFKAVLELANDGDVAFTYNINLQLKGDAENPLADQLLITITHADGTVTSRRLNEFANGISIEAGKMKATDTAQQFTIEVTFLDDVDVNKTETPEDQWINNNAAQEKDVSFDLNVTAVQATNKSN